MSEEKKKELTLEGVQTELKAAVAAVGDKWKNHYEELKASGADYGEHLEAVKKIADNAMRRIEEAEALLDTPDFVKRTVAGEVKSIGELVTENPLLVEKCEGQRGEYFQGKLEIPIHNLSVPGEKNAGSFFPERLAMVQALVPELKTDITTGTIGSATSGVLVQQRLPGIVKPGVPRVRVRDLIPRLPCTSNAVDFVKELLLTNAASPQVEAAAKGESALTFEVDTEVIRTIAHFIPISRQALDDFVMLQAYVNMRLLDGLADEEDDQILRGSDTGQDLKGLTSSATAYDTSTYAETGDTKIDKILRMFTQIEVANLTPSGSIVNPADWRRMQSLKQDDGGGTGTGRYILGGPQGTSPHMLWGLPIATASRMTAGTAIVGAFASHVILWDRMKARVDVSLENQDNFEKNMVTIRAEERVALTTLRSDAVIYASSF